MDAFLLAAIWLSGGQGCFLAPDKIEAPPVRLPLEPPLRQKMVTLFNPSPLARTRAVAMVPIRSLGFGAIPAERIEVSNDGIVIPSQGMQLALRDGRESSYLMLQLDFQPREKKVVVVLGLPAEQTGPRFPAEAAARYEFRYDGYAAIESSLAGYGLYARYPIEPFRGALQLKFFGKPVRVDDPARPPLVLCTGRPLGANARREAVDLLRVGKSMGLGGPIIGRSRPIHGRNASVSYRVANNGPLAATVAVNVRGWHTTRGGQYDAVFRYTMYAGKQYVELDATLTPIQPSAERFGVGMTVCDKDKVFRYDLNRKYLCQWGQQTGRTSHVGMAILAPNQQIAGIDVLADDRGDNRVVYFEPELSRTEPVQYRIFLLGTWPGAGVRDAKQFLAYVQRLAINMAHPIEVRLSDGTGRRKARAQASRKSPTQEPRPTKSSPPP